MPCREGKAWAGASGMVGGCEAYKPLMQQLQLLCTACVAAVNEVRFIELFAVRFFGPVKHLNTINRVGTKCRWT